MATCVGIIHTMGSAREPFVVHFVDNPGPAKIALRPELYSLDGIAARFSWCVPRRKSVGILGCVRHVAHVLI